MAFGTPRVFDKKFKFLVEIDGVVSAKFQKCSELSAEIAKVEYHEGGAVIPDKSPGKVTVSDLTLERGACRDADLFTWFKQVIDITAQTGQIDPQFKRSLDIVQLDRDGSELRRWTVTGAWPTKFVAGAWDNEADENVIESVVLAIDTFDKTAGI